MILREKKLGVQKSSMRGVALTFDRWGNTNVPDRHYKLEILGGAALNTFLAANPLNALKHRA